ncbi:hypothetical protein H9Q70_009727 [Fusarium xylarioides]|nr:hypothetical protein H9Q70_009727 [Fusarium xylarioides]
MSSFSSTLICRNLNDRVRRPTGPLGQVHGPTIHTLHLPFFLSFLSAFLYFVVLTNRPSKSSRYLISRPDLRISSKLRQNGPHFRPPRCAQRHQQRREGWQAPGPDPTFFQGHHQVPPGYAAPRIGEFEEVDDHRSGKIVVQLNGRLNKTGVISPRYNVRLSELEKWVVKLLPARQFGYVILTTSAGIMDHEEARRKHVSGKIIGFFY